MFSASIERTYQLSTRKQIDFLDRLGFDGRDLAIYDASRLLTNILRPIDNALWRTFKGCISLLKKNELRDMQVAIARSDIYRALPLYGPDSTRTALEAAGLGDGRLTRSQREAITLIAFHTLPPKTFLLLPSNGVKKFKDALDAKLQNAG